MTGLAAEEDAPQHPAQRRTLVVLSLAQVLGGLSNGVALGVGSLLVEEALRRAAATGFPLVLVVGHPEYYPRFGFEPADVLGVEAPWEVPAEAWMLHRLPPYRSAARGLVTYPAAFDEVT